MRVVDKIIDKFDSGELFRYVDNEKLSVNTSDNIDYKGLYLWKYTKQVQSEDLWDNTLLQCRGLITNVSGVVIARPYNKFFNSFELDENYVNSLYHNYGFDILEKLDGSLGILFNYNDKWLNATSGSFNSDQSIWFRNKLKKYDLHGLDKSKTYLFELIYPDNKIVVDYGNKERIVLTGIVSTKTGDLSSYNDIVSVSKKYGFEYPKLFTKKEMDDIVNKNIKNFEGFIIRFSNNQMIKIKLEEYVRLHRILTNLTTRNIYFSWLEDSGVKLLSEVEEENVCFVRKHIKYFEYRKLEIYNYHFKLALSVYLKVGFNKKSIAIYINDNLKKNDKKININLIFDILSNKKNSDTLNRILSRERIYSEYITDKNLFFIKLKKKMLRFFRKIIM